MAISIKPLHPLFVAEIGAVDVTRLDDRTLADLIRKDQIDVLVDLSGHSAGSRLTAFALRPARVQVTWLGYFATTGLACMDGVLLDPWHVAADAQAYFSERIIPLKTGRFCYTPVPWGGAGSSVPKRLHHLLVLQQYVQVS